MLSWRAVLVLLSLVAACSGQPTSGGTGDLSLTSQGSNTGPQSTSNEQHFVAPKGHKVTIIANKNSLTQDQLAPVDDRANVQAKIKKEGERLSEKLKEQEVQLKLEKLKQEKAREDRRRQRLKEQLQAQSSGLNHIKKYAKSSGSQGNDDKKAQPKKQ